jgi:glycosyltransferase involved in cell wall biosynthesis
MRILTLTCEYPPIGGGGATAAAALAPALVRAGHEVDVVTVRLPGLPAIEERNGVRIFSVPGWRRRIHYSTAVEQASFLVPMYHAAMRLHARRRYDLVHCHFIVPTGVVGWLVFQRTGLPYVLTAHGSDVPGYNTDRFGLIHRVIQPTWRRIVASAAAVTSPSQFVAQLLHKQGVEGVTVLPNPVDPLPKGTEPRTKRILCVARLVPRKGVQHLIQAMTSIGRDWELVIAGDGPMRANLRDMAAELDVRVRFEGFVPREQLPQLYLSSSVFVLPSLQENFPMVLVEAMAAGCAVVTTDGSGCAELVGSAGRLVPAGDASALASALADLTRDAGAIAALGLEGRRSIRRFKSSRIAADFVTLFERYA